MTVQTTFAGGVNPWLKYFIVEPVNRRSYVKQMKINFNKLKMFDNKNNLVEMGDIQNSRDIFDKIGHGFRLEFCAEDHRKIIRMFCKFKNRQLSSFRLCKFEKKGMIMIEDKNAAS